MMRLDLFKDPCSEIRPEMLVLAQKARGMTQAELAEKLGLSQGFISKIQDGLQPFPSNLIETLERVLGFRRRFYLRNDFVEGAPPGLYRKRKLIPAKQLAQCEARLAIAQQQLKRLIDSCEPPLVRIPRIDPDSMNGDLEAIAEVVRQVLRIPSGPIENLTKIIERAGCLIVPFVFGTSKIDACSEWIAGTPVIFINPELCPSRYRYTLLHELGHLVMHEIPSDLSEIQADGVAAAIALPADEIRSMLLPLTLDRLGRLKLHWRVSMQSLLMRAKSLGVASDYKLQELWKGISSRGWKTREPFEDRLPIERPELVHQLIEVHRKDLKYSDAEISEKLDIFESEFSAQFNFKVNFSPNIV